MSFPRFPFISLGLSLFIFILLVSFLYLFYSHSSSQINTNQIAVIKEMRSLQRLETASFTIEKVIGGGTTGDNAFTQFFFGDKILLIAHGQVIAGFDFSQMSERDIAIKGKTITVTLPRPQILTTTLDNAQTRVYDRQKGLLAPEDKDLESNVRAAAEKSIREAACSEGILQQASDNARKQLTALFSTLGFTAIDIHIQNASC